MTGLTRLALSAMLLALTLAAPNAASAGTWKVQGLFSDGTVLSGRFTTNYYGFLDTAALATQASGVFSGATYGRSGDSFGNFPNGFSISQNAYQDDLTLVFASDITTATKTVALLATSYECRGSGYCYDASAGNVRYLVSGVATIPEPTSWMLMIAGFGLVGTALRLRKTALQ